MKASSVSTSPPINGETFYVETTIVHRAIAAHYGANSPVGGIVRYRSDPANQNSYMFIVAYDQGASSITCRTETSVLVSSGGPVHISAQGGTSYWGILNHPFDLRQAGQCAAMPTDLTSVATQLSSTKQVFRAVGDWMSGSSSVSGWYKVATVSGSYLTMDGVGMGRQSGNSEDSVGNWAINPNGLNYLTWNDIDFRQAHSRSSDSMVFWAGAISNPDITNVSVGEFGQGGCFRGGTFTGGTFDGLVGEELGRTLILLREDGAGFVLSNVTGVGNRTVHGNITSTYTVSRNITLEKILTSDSILNSTSQVEGTFAVGRNITYRQAIATPPRDISTSTGAGASSANTCLSIDDGFNFSLYDRIWAPVRAGSGQVMVLTGGGEVSAQGNENNSGEFRRSVFDGLSIDTDAGNPDPDFPGGPVEINSVLSTYSGNSAATWAARGCSVTDSEVDAAAISAGGISLKAWEYLTRTEPFNPGTPTYEAFQLGPDWIDWQLPAYVPASPSANVGTPVDLVLSRSWYRINQQAGRTAATILRMRPGTNGNTPSANGNFWIDASYGAGAIFILDKGYLVPVVRMTASSYTIRIYEQTLAGVLRATTLVLEGPR